MYISTNRLNTCTATNINFDYSKEITFSVACKKAAEQQIINLKVNTLHMLFFPMCYNSNLTLTLT